MSTNNLLLNVYLFKDMTPAELEKIGTIAKQSSYVPGDEIFNQGDEAHSLYVIRYGSVRIQQKSKEGDGVDVAHLGTGSHFGEMAFVDGEKRSATVSVVEKTEIVSLDFDGLRKVLDANPGIAVKFYKSLCLFLCGRLRITTNDLSFAREKNLRHF
ncbi:MAG: cyclic nucleotide-binding domain-containing protein [Bdellovibrionaceae bacterium]|nr:cyclic nucleotide-binding domain-containing protein [Pseudobdellovibrionaceae bacterium]